MQAGVVQWQNISFPIGTYFQLFQTLNGVWAFSGLTGQIGEVWADMTVARAEIGGSRRSR
jgi:hypothetical protein